MSRALEDGLFADLDETIRRLLIRSVPLDPAEIEISFDAPDREWSGRLSRPAVNCFLYDVRENTKLRHQGWDVRRDNANNTATRHRTLTRIDASYQVTAWARVIEDEHRLFSRVLLALARHPSLPADLLQGELNSQPLPIPTSVAQPDQMPANFADFWQVLDNRIRPTVTYVITVAIDPEIAVTTPLVLTAPSLKLLNPEPDDLAATLRDGTHPVRGRVRDRQDHTRPVAGALVVLRETGEQTLTGDEGYFTIGPVRPGPITLVVRAAGRDETTWPCQVPSSSFELEV